MLLNFKRFQTENISICVCGGDYSLKNLKALKGDSVKGEGIKFLPSHHRNILQAIQV